MLITAETPVRDIAVEVPPAITVMERFGIDYCCGGQHTLAEACARRDLNLGIVLKELESQQQSATGLDIHWEKASLPKLSEHIVRRHHAFARQQIKLIGELMAKVENRHGAAHPEVFHLGKVIAVASAELTHHFYCEENTLFPYIAGLGTAQQPELPARAGGGMQQPVTRMMMDHDQTGDELRTLREMTSNYTPPSDACSTWRALYRALEDLEMDLHQHIHLENNILFPRALEEAKAV